MTYYDYPQKSRNPYIIVLIMLGISLVLFLGTIFWIYISSQYDDTSAGSTSIDNEFGSSANTGTKPTTSSNAPIPDKAYVKVPFTTQAPKANWDATHEESCEEASLIMVKHFLDKTDIGSTDQADEEILSLVDWENANGYSVDVTLGELNQIAKNHYGITNGTVKQNITIDDIKREIAAGKPVIIGASGKSLQNPNFKDGGPLYHMLVIVGYDQDGFITNDPGTRKGEDFRYTYNVLYNAIHDWNSSDIMSGGKDLLVFE